MELEPGATHSGSFFVEASMQIRGRVEGTKLGHKMEELVPRSRDGLQGGTARRDYMQQQMMMMGLMRQSQQSEYSDLASGMFDSKLP